MWVFPLVLCNNCTKGSMLLFQIFFVIISNMSISTVYLDSITCRINMELDLQSLFGLLVRSSGGHKEMSFISWLTNSALVQYMSQNAGGWGLRGLSHWVQLCIWNLNKLWRSNPWSSSIFNLWHSCTHWLRPWIHPSQPTHLGSYARGPGRYILVSQDRRHLFGTCYRKALSISNFRSNFVLWRNEFVVILHVLINPYFA